MARRRSDPPVRRGARIPTPRPRPPVAPGTGLTRPRLPTLPPRATAEPTRPPTRRTETACDKAARDIVRTLRNARGILADAHVEAGNKLTECRAKLQERSWYAWIDQKLPFTQRTAFNYIALANWAAEHSADYQRWRHLGPTKLYALAALPPRLLTRVRNRNSHTVPATGERKTLEELSVRELWDVLRAMTDTDATPPELAQFLSSFRRRLTGLTGAVVVLLGYRRDLDPDTAADLHADLQEAADQIADAFGLAA